MNRSSIVPALVLSAVLVIAGCGSSSSTSKASSSSSTGGTATSATSASSASSSSASTSSSAANSSAGGAATLDVAMNSKIGQQIVVDGSGKTVYLYEPDGAGPTSQVPSGIKPNWPAVSASAGPTAGSGLDQSKLATQTQPDGTKQVTYNGHLLYTFVGDAAPGDASGQGLGGVWFTVSAAGDKIG